MIRMYFQFPSVHHGNTASIQEFMSNYDKIQRNVTKDVIYWKQDKINFKNN